MTTVIHRLNRGPFCGYVERHDDGPFAGWFSYHWQAGTMAGGTEAIGRAGAISALHAACLNYFLMQQQDPPPRQ